MPGIGTGDEMEHLVRPRAINDTRGIEPERRRDRLAQRARARVGITLKIVRMRGKGGARVRAGAKRIFIRAELDDGASVIAGRAAWNIGRNRHDPVFGAGSGHGVAL